MDEEILFRGKDYDGNWVEGDLIHGVGCKKGRVYILPIRHNIAYVKNCDPLDGVIVNPETVGQFIGLTYKNGKNIFTGDILTNNINKIGVVVYFDGSFCLKVISRKGNIEYQILNSGFLKNKEVIGNITDNPELLK